MTAIDIINSASRLAGILGTGETMSGQESADGLSALNDVLDMWSAGELWNTVNTTVTTTPGQSVYTVGPVAALAAPDWILPARPVRISGAFVTWGGADFPLQIIDQATFNGVAVKHQQQPIVERLMYVNEVPHGVVTLWPVPAQAVTLTLSIDNVLTRVETLQADIQLPPGAALALKCQLAQRLAVEYGRELSPAVSAMGTKAMADYKRGNNPLPPSLGFAPELVTPGAALWQRGW